MVKAKRTGKLTASQRKSLAVATQISEVLKHVCQTHQAAEMLGLSEETTRRYCNQGVFKYAEKLRRDWLIPIYEIEEYRRTRLGKVGRPRG